MTSTPMTRDAFRNLTNLTPALRAVFMEQMTALGSSESLLSLFDVQNSTGAQESMMGVSGLGLVPEFTGAMEYDAPEQLYRKDYQHKEYVRAMAVERKLLDDDQMGVIRQRAEMLGLAFDRTVETHAASVFANAFTAGAFAGADGVALCGAHPNSPTDSATQSNSGTSALDATSLTATRTAMMRMKDSRGAALPIVPDTLIVPVELEPAAWTLVNSGQIVGSANNDANYNRSRYRVIGTQLLTDNNNWFLVDSRAARMYLRWFWRVRPEFKEDANSDFDLVGRYRGYMRYSFGWDHWTWIYGHAVS